MDQISVPMRIALVAVLAVAGLWFTVLKPKSGDSAPASAPARASASTGVHAPGVAGLGRAVKAARDTAAGRPVHDPVPAASDPTQAHPAPAAPATASPASPPAATAAPARPKPAPKPAVGTLSTRSGPAATTDGRATILLFSGSGADDAVARQAVRQLRGPRVRTIIAPISQVTRYRQLIGDIQIQATPTILVISPQGTARELVGLPDPLEIQQLLTAALHD